MVKVRETRIDVPGLEGLSFIEVVEEATGRTVRAFFSSVTHDPDIAVELFLLEPAAPSTDGSTS